MNEPNYHFKKVIRQAGRVFGISEKIKRRGIEPSMKKGEADGLPNADSSIECGPEIPPTPPKPPVPAESGSDSVGANPGPATGAKAPESVRRPAAMSPPRVRGDREPMLSEIAAADFLSLSPGTLRNWRTKRLGPEWHKIGGSVRYTMADLEKYLAASRQPTSTAEKRCS